MSKNPHKIGNLVCVLRKAKKLTQDELADQVGCKRSHIARLEKRSESDMFQLIQESIRKENDRLSRK